MAKERNSQSEQRPYTPAGIRALARILDEFDLSSLEVVSGDQRISLTREHASRVAAVHSAAAGPMAPATPSQPAPEAAASPAEPEAGIVVTSPFVGTFYRAPSPDAPPFVEVGQVVKRGQALCIVEAMKLMNEIEAEQGLRILEILVKNGESVEFGQALFRVEPLG